MKFTIAALTKTTVNTKYGAKEKYRFTSHDGGTYDAWAKKGFTDNFKVGYVFEADLSGKPYQGIDTISWPKQQGYGQPQANDPTIHAKLDEILRILKGKKVETGYGVSNVLTPTEIPYADSPPPSDEDAPY